MKFKHSIRQLAAAVLAFALALRAFLHPSPLWAATMFGLAIATCTLATAGIFSARGRARPACLGAAACGWAYLLAIYGPWAAAEIGPLLPTNACIDLLYRPPGRADLPEVARKKVERLRLLSLYGQAKMEAGREPSPQNKDAVRSRREQIVALDAWVLQAGGIGELDRGATASRWARWTAPNRTPSIGWVSAPQDFQRIAHSFFAIASALVGGACARLIAGRGSAGEEPPAGPEAA